MTSSAVAHAYLAITRARPARAWRKRARGDATAGGSPRPVAGLVSAQGRFVFGAIQMPGVWRKRVSCRPVDGGGVAAPAGSINFRIEIAARERCIRAPTIARSFPAE
jgi:hypothetical protein